MLLLGIETSCDETAASVVRDGKTVLSNIISSSKEQFAFAGGVVPEEAARSQCEYMLPVIHRACGNANATLDSIDAIAVTRGPGLLGSLLVGTTAARVLSSLFQKPLIGVHHTLGHLSSPWLDAENDPHFPLIALSVSGGHTDLWYRESHTRNMRIGSTRDDAAGEAFDKGASLLGLPYPGGPALSRAAEGGNPQAFPFPLPLSHESSCEFSFSGLKTALKCLLRDTQDWQLQDIAAAFQEAICLHLLDKLKLAAAKYPTCEEIHIVGGVSANTRLRQLCTEAFPTKIVRTPRKLSYCTDNGAMIAAAAFGMMQEDVQNAMRSFATSASTSL